MQLKKCNGSFVYSVCCLYEEVGVLAIITVGYIETLLPGTTLKH